MIKNLFIAFFVLLLLPAVTNANVIKFAQVTDTHFNTEKHKQYILESAVNSLNKEKDIKFVVFTGDNIDSPKIEILPDFVKIVNKLKVPYYLVLGDHDVFKNGGLSKTKYLETVRENNFLYRFKNPNYVFQNNGFVFVVVDGAKEVIPGTMGYYNQNTLQWLEKQLNKFKDKPVIIFQHFPLLEPSNIKSHTVYKKEEYINLLDKYDNVIAVVSGHYHINGEQMRNGVYHISSPTLLANPPVYKVITVTTTKGFSPMIFTELKEVKLLNNQ